MQLCNIIYITSSIVAFHCSFNYIFSKTKNTEIAYLNSMLPMPNLKSVLYFRSEAYLRHSHAKDDIDPPKMT